MDEYEYEGYVPGTTVWAQINKVGGGTPPKQYVGMWEYTLRDTTRDGRVVMQGSDLNIPLLATHAMAAKVAFEFLPEEPQAPAVHIHVGANMPGYLPELDVMCFDNVEDALEALRHEIKDQQDYYEGNCEGSRAEVESGDCSCDWCEVYGDCEAAIGAIADGDTAYAFGSECEAALAAITEDGRARPVGIGWIFSPPEGPDIHHWMTMIPADRDSCEIFLDQES